jgi:hypothetical protein
MRCRVRCEQKRWARAQAQTFFNSAIFPLASAVLYIVDWPR